MLKAACQRGFTMIELAVTVSILAILIALGAPEMAQMFRTAGVRSLAESVQNGLQKARAEALKRNQVVTLWLVSPKDAGTLDQTCALSSASGSWVVSLDSPAGKCDVDPSTTTAPRTVEKLGAGPRAGGLTVAATDASGNAATSVSFNGTGQVVRTGTQIAQIDITHSDASARRLRIQVSSTGSVRLCDRDVGTGDTRACI